MRTLFKAIPFLGFLIFTSCKSKIEAVMDGMWSIDTLYYKKHDVKNCFYLNVINFEKDNVLKLPEYGIDCDTVIKRGKAKIGEWQIVESTTPNDTMPYKIKITSDSEVFSGIHRMVFHRDDVNKLLKLEIWSDSLYMICRKGLFDFDHNKKMVFELEKKTWTTRHN